VSRLVELLHNIENAAFEGGFGDIRRWAIEALDLVDPVDREEG
jgi:hypothetical protein